MEDVRFYSFDLINLMYVFIVNLRVLFNYLTLFLTLLFKI